MFKLSSRRDTIILLCILLLAYSYVLPRWGDWNQSSRLSLVRALVERGTIRIDSYIGDTGSYAVYKGHAYTDKAPGPSFVALPVYAVVLPLVEQPFVQRGLGRLATSAALQPTLRPGGGGLTDERVREFVAQYVLTLVVVSLPTALASVALYSFLATFGFSRGVRLLVTLGYGIGSPAATYAGNFYSHQFVANLCLVAFILLVRLHKGSGGIRRAFLVGLLCGSVSISEYPAGLIVAVFGLYALLSLDGSRIAAIVAGALPPLLLFSIYNYSAFETLYPAGYYYSAAWSQEYSAGFASITHPQIDALWGLTFGTFRGLFVRAPWLLLAVPGFVIWWRSRPLWRIETATAALATIGLLGVYTSASAWWGGYAAGPRYLVPIIPFLAIAAGFAVHALWQVNLPRLGTAIPRAGCVLLVCCSVVLTWIEALAGQGFPSDLTRDTWQAYVFPAWERGDVARNLGMLLGLRGPASLLPLGLGLALLIGLLIVSPHLYHSPRPNGGSASRSFEPPLLSERM